jgi:hypothetical protein
MPEVGNLLRPMAEAAVGVLATLIATPLRVIWQFDDSPNGAPALLMMEH